MDYTAYLSGTPLLPLQLLVGLGISFLLLALLAYKLFSRSLKKATFTDRILRFGKISFGIGILAGLLALYLLIPPPAATKITTTRNSIEITFNRPVSRRMLEKTIEPEVPGVWIFGKPIYGSHFTRSVTFYPDNPLPTGQEYTISLASIVNTLKLSKPYSHELSVKTDPSPQTTISQDSGKLVAHFYPADGDVGIDPTSAIKVVFDSEVDQRLAESAFTTSPKVAGKLAWEGRTLVLSPTAPLTQNTKYTISVLGTSVNFTTAPSRFKLTVPAYLQQHALSCEVSTLRMALAYRGVTATEETLLAQVGLDPTPHQGSTWGNPHQAFVGNVDGRQMTTGYGVYWSPIARVARMYRNATEFQGWSVGQLTAELKNGNPVIIWGYSKGGVPTHWFTPGGEKIYAVSGEHTVVAVGYVGPSDNPSQIIVNDPLVGQVYWSRATFDKKWNSFNRSGVVVY